MQSVLARATLAHYLVRPSLTEAHVGLELSVGSERTRRLVLDGTSPPNGGGFRNRAEGRRLESPAEGVGEELGRYEGGEGRVGRGREVVRGRVELYGGSHGEDAGRDRVDRATVVFVVVIYAKGAKAQSASTSRREGRETNEDSHSSMILTQRLQTRIFPSPPKRLPVMMLAAHLPQKIWPVSREQKERERGQLLTRRSALALRALARLTTYPAMMLPPIYREGALAVIALQNKGGSVSLGLISLFLFAHCLSSTHRLCALVCHPEVLGQRLSSESPDDPARALRPRSDSTAPDARPVPDAPHAPRVVVQSSSG